MAAIYTFVTSSLIGRWIIILCVTFLVLCTGLLFGSTDQASLDFIMQLRMPRVLTAFTCGGLLALSGALLQSLTNNPLAEPYLLGVAGGASNGALLSLFFFNTTIVSMTVGAGVGALLALAILLALLVACHYTNSHFNYSAKFVLIGVALATIYNAITALLLSIMPIQHIPGILFWMMGDLGNVSHPQWSIGVFIACLAFTPWLGKRTNVLLLGEEKAFTLGLPIQAIRYLLILTSAVATGCAVAIAGTIGFIGLIIPHTIRILWGNDQRFLLPACLFIGGNFLVLADLIARTIIAPIQLPVGVITALLGVPFFISLIIRHQR